MSLFPDARTSFSLMREQAGLTLKEAAGKLRISESTANRYEKGRQKVSPPVMRLLETLVTERRRSQRAVQPGFRFIDLFAGIGGLRIGFEGIGGRCVFTSEWDRFSRETYA